VRPSAEVLQCGQVLQNPTGLYEIEAIFRKSAQMKYLSNFNLHSKWPKTSGTVTKNYISHGQSPFFVSLNRTVKRIL